jgi:hypothetical protein
MVYQCTWPPTVHILFVSLHPANVRIESSAELSYQTARRPFVCALASDLECNIVGRVALDLQSGLRQMVKVLCKEVVRGLCDIRKCWDGHLEGRRGSG